MTSAAQLILNPRMPNSEATELRSLFEKWQRPGDLWLASSGSSRGLTDSLKLIVLTESGLSAAAESGNRYLQATKKDRWLQTLPVFHVGGQMIGRRAQAIGAEVLPAQFTKWSALDFHQQIANDQITLASLVPTQVFDLVHAKLRAPSSLRAVLIGGAALDSSLDHAARALGWPLLPGYGMTEAGALLAGAQLSTAQDSQAPEAFFLLDHIEAKISTDGILQIRGPSLLRGWAQLQKGQSVFQEHPAGQWYTTQDRAKLQTTDTGVALKILGRESDYIKIKGEGVDLGRLRRVLREIIPALRLPPDSIWLEAIPNERAGFELVLVIEQAYDRPEIRRALRLEFQKKVMPFEYWQREVSLPALPRTALHKIDRAELLRRLASASKTGVS